MWHGFGEKSCAWKTDVNDMVHRLNVRNVWIGMRVRIAMTMMTMMTMMRKVVMWIWRTMSRCGGRRGVLCNLV